MRPPIRVTAPAAPPVSLAEVKQHLRVDFDAEDALTLGYLAAAVAHLDAWAGILGRCMVSQAWRQDFDRFESCLRLPFPDASGAVIKYFDAHENEIEVSSSDYNVHEDARGAIITLKSGKSWPSVGETRPSVSVTANYGFGTDSDVPAALKSAILMHVQSLYERDANPALMRAHDALIAPYRRI